MEPGLPKGRVWAALALLAAIPALHAVILLGRIHPDEVYQVLEPAYHRVHGYGILAWEWQPPPDSPFTFKFWQWPSHGGIRNWAVPLFFAAFLKVCAVLGIDNPRVYRTVLELPQFGLHLAMLFAVFRYTRRRIESDAWSLFAVAAVALHGLVILFAGRTMSESFSAAFLVLGIEAIDRAYHGEPDSRTLRNAGLLGGLWLGLSVVARYGSAVVVIALLLYVLASRRFRLLGYVGAAGAGVALLLGLLDWVTWGRPFHSLVAYLNYNVFSGEAARTFGEAPWSFYTPWLWRELPFWAWLGLLGILFGKDKPRIPVALVGGVAYFAAIATTAHKEERFLYPGLLLLAVACVPAMTRLVRALPNFQLRALVGAAALFVTTLPIFYTDWPELRADQLRAITHATRGDATGLLIVNEGVWGAGGYFYIGKNIPWGVCDFGNEPRFIYAVRDPRINRAVTFEDRAVAELQAAGFKEVARIGRETVFAR